MCCSGLCATSAQTFLSWNYITLETVCDYNDMVWSSLVYFNIRRSSSTISHSCGERCSRRWVDPAYPLPTCTDCIQLWLLASLWSDRTWIETSVYDVDVTCIYKYIYIFFVCVCVSYLDWTWTIDALCFVDNMIIYCLSIQMSSSMSPLPSFKWKACTVSRQLLWESPSVWLDCSSHENRLFTWSEHESIVAALDEQISPLPSSTSINHWHGGSRILRKVVDDAQQHFHITNNTSNKKIS